MLQTAEHAQHTRLTPFKKSHLELVLYAYKICHDYYLFPGFSPLPMASYKQALSDSLRVNIYTEEMIKNARITMQMLCYLPEEK